MASDEDDGNASDSTISTIIVSSDDSEYDTAPDDVNFIGMWDMDPELLRALPHLSVDERGRVVGSNSQRRRAQYLRQASQPLVGSSGNRRGGTVGNSITVLILMRNNI